MATTLAEQFPKYEKTPRALAKFVSGFLSNLEAKSLEKEQGELVENFKTKIMITFEKEKASADEIKVSMEQVHELMKRDATAGQELVLNSLVNDPAACAKVKLAEKTHRRLKKMNSNLR